MNTLEYIVGLENSVGLLEPLIEAGTSLPVERSLQLTNNEDFQPIMALNIYAGLCKKAAANTLLTSLEVYIKRQCRGHSFNVSLFLDLDGSATVTLWFDSGRCITRHFTVNLHSIYLVSDEDKTQDMEFEQLAILKMLGKNILHSYQKFFNKLNDQVHQNQDVISDVSQLLVELSYALEGKDYSELESCLERLTCWDFYMSCL